MYVVLFIKQQTHNQSIIIPPLDPRRNKNINNLNACIHDTQIPIIKQTNDAVKQSGGVRVHVCGCGCVYGVAERLESRTVVEQGVTPVSTHGHSLDATDLPWFSGGSRSRSPFGSPAVLVHVHHLVLRVASGGLHRTTDSSTLGR